MMILRRVAVAVAILPLWMGLSACTGGEQTSAQTSSKAPAKAAPPVTVNPAQKLDAISPAIPLYAGAEYDGNLTRRDNATLANRYGVQSTVYTLATHDSFPQVWHYYVTYLAQFRSFEPIRPFPPSNQVARSIEVRLNDAMQDPFIPGDTLDMNQKQVILQVAEGEGGNGTIIRYIVRPPQLPRVSIADASSGAGRAMNRPAPAGSRLSF